MKREIVAATRKLVLVTGCTMMGSAAFCGWMSTALGAAPVPTSYAGLSCEQLSSEYDRLNRSLMSDGAGAGAGAAEGVASATQCLPGVGLGSIESTAHGLERSIMTSDTLHRIGAVREAHQAQGCTTKLEMSKAAATALADEKAAGERDYKNSCALCHGDTAKGNGWFTKYLTERPPSLAQVQKNNGGVFPFEHMYEVIDGRIEVKVHGPRDMPVWGRIYVVQADMGREMYLGQLSSVEQLARIRIRALVNYIAQLQE